MPGLIGLCGSLRKDSHNAKLMRAAAAIYGGAFTPLDLRLPLYDGDLERDLGVPEAVLAMSAEIEAAEAVIVVSPEYNSGISGVLKNTLDWISRDKTRNPWRDKPVAIMTAAAGRSGGARATQDLRLALTPFRPLIVPGPEVMVAAAADHFDAEGRLASERYRKSLTELMECLRRAAAGAR